MKNIMWHPILLMPVAAGILMMLGFYEVAFGTNPDFYFEAGNLLTVIGIVIYSHLRLKKMGIKRLIVRRKK